MDHLFPLQNPRHEPVRVPCLCSGEYDNGPFIDYPQRTQRPRIWPGGSLDYLSKEDIRPREEEASFLQMWLFFGLLFAVLGVPIPPKDFYDIVEDGTVRLIHTRNLPKYLEE